MITYINARCIAWAYHVAGKAVDVGYPHQSSIANFMAAASSGRIPINVREAEEIDAAVTALRPERELYEVVMLFYCNLVEGRRVADSSAVAMAQRLGIHRDTFYARLHRAHVRIMEWLQDNDMPVELTAAPTLV